VPVNSNKLVPAVFLDRDGVINAPVVREGKPYPPERLEDFALLPGVLEGCKALKAAGYLLVVATNQPDVGRGTQKRKMVEAMHQRMCALLPLDRVGVCYDSGGGAQSPLRKPAPGMLLAAAEALGIELAQSWMIGDRWRDVECGRGAGCRTIFIDCGYREKLAAPPTHTVRDFAAAVRIILDDRPRHGRNEVGEAAKKVESRVSRDERIPLTPSLSPSEGERVSAGQVRGTMQHPVSGI
jgi:D-glycero-D-manno-heptose 1,7-bisphosphate phosphatase